MDAGAVGARKRAFVAKQVFRWIQKRGVLDPARMSNLSAKVREALTAEGVKEITTTENVHRSADGTKKAVLRLHDGATIEMVLLPSVLGRGSAAEMEMDADSAAARTTTTTKRRSRSRWGDQITVSRRRWGARWVRLLCERRRGLKSSARRIVAQVLAGNDARGTEQPNVVFMGMGSLHNYEATAYGGC
jgi:23S rRNA (adenine2503-C2)-methyltransferase